jgi:hypothetical protein
MLDALVSALQELGPAPVIVGEPIPHEKTQDQVSPPAPEEGILAFARSIMDGEPVELRVLGHSRGTLSGVFATPEDLAAAAAGANETGDVYVTPNPVTLEPRPLRVIGNGDGTSNDDISRIRWFLIDVDIYDDNGATAVAVKEWLESIGFPDPLMLCSGNGYQLWYRYDGPNTETEAALRQRGLRVLAEKFPGIDISVHNAARIMRFAYTTNLNRKGRGDGQPKASRWITPDDAVLKVLPRKTLKALAAMAPAEAPMTSDQGVRSDLKLIEEKLLEHDITLRNPHPAKGNRGTIWSLSKCPFYPDGSPNGVHNGAALWEWNDGNIGFRCQGNSCIAADHRILDLLELLGLEREVVTDDDGELQWGTFTDIKATPREYAWGKKLVRAASNLLVGDEDIGKGILQAYLAAEITTGRLTGTPERVLIVSTEDSKEQDIKPRLVVAGADTDLCIHINPRDLRLPSGAEKVRRFLESTKVRWLFFDPLNDYFDSGLDPNKTKDVSAVMNCLTPICQDTNATVVGNLHTNRGTGLEGRARIAHQLQFRRSARSMLVLGKMPEDGKDDRTLVHDKSNTSRKDPALSLTIRGKDVELDGATFEDVGYIVVLGETDATVEQMMLKQVDTQGQIKELRVESERTKTKAAGLRLRILGLFGKELRMPASTMRQTLGDEGYDNKELTRARDKLGITSEGEDWVLRPE